MTARNVSPAVTRWRLTVVGDQVCGYAAPAGGPLPCLLRLEADGAAIAIAYATGYRNEAAAAGIRLGWCGVALPGLRQAAGIADRVQVRCGATGLLLLDVPLDEPDPLATRPVMTAADILAHARGRDGCAATTHILPFAAATLRGGGIAGLMAAAYRSLLGREADAAIVAAWQAHPPDDPVSAVLAMILTSEEYRAAGGVIPGPFHPAFGFDLAPLDDRFTPPAG